MKAVLQVVTHATVRVDGGITGQIGPGLLVFLGVAEEDEQADLDKIVKKVFLFHNLLYMQIVKKEEDQVL